MAINYTWDVSRVDVYPTKEGKDDVVHNIHWRIIGADDSNNDSDGNAQRSSVYGTQVIDTSDLLNFTAFADLNSTIVQGWVEDALGESTVNELKQTIDNEISEKVNPTSETKTIGE